MCCISFVSYIKPQQRLSAPATAYSCISFVSYIKPQLRNLFVIVHRVVYRSFPTSNHNAISSGSDKARVVYRSFPTSNHNISLRRERTVLVVYRSFPTSNHNYRRLYSEFDELYIVRFLHQTTTGEHIAVLTPMMYIVRFLHQTTTSPSTTPKRNSCISFVSYIKPQPILHILLSHTCCISFVSYIKPQL